MIRRTSLATLLLRHAGAGAGQVVFIHERLSADVREIALGINNHEEPHSIWPADREHPPWAGTTPASRA